MENLHSWQKFYTTAGRDGRDKFQVWLWMYGMGILFSGVCSGRLAGSRSALFSYMTTVPMQRRPRTSRLQKMGAMKRSDHWRVLIRGEKPKVFWANLTQLGCRGFRKQLESSGRILSVKKYGEIKKKTTFVRAKTQTTALNQQSICSALL